LHVVDISHAQHEDQIGVVNKTLQEIKAFDKPVITIFNKMDQYEEKNFDDWLEDEVKEDIMRELHQKWNNITEGNAIFISATERLNIDELRSRILQKVKELYTIRYPYRDEYLY